MKMTNIQSTFDFYLASYLIAIGIKLQAHKKQNGKTAFYFKDDKKTIDAINSFYSMSASVEPIIFSNSIKALKSILHSYANTNINSEENNYVKQYKGNN